MTKDQLAAQKTSLTTTLKSSGATQAQIDQVSAAFDKVVSDQQQANLQKLSNDLSALQAGSDVTEAQVKALQTSLYAMCDGATKPSQESVNNLGTDLTTALDDGDLSNKEMAQLTHDLEAVLNSAGIPISEFTTVVNNLKAILTSSNIDKTDIEAIAADCKAIYDALNPPSSVTSPASRTTPAAGTEAAAARRSVSAR